MRQTLLAALFALGLPACTGLDNQAACQTWEATIHCAPDGGTGEAYDVTKAIHCSDYKEYTCDLAANGFWKCLSDNFHCVNGVADTTWMNSSCHTKGLCK